jgi:hypothetical protein
VKSELLILLVAVSLYTLVVNGCGGGSEQQGSNPVSNGTTTTTVKPTPTETPEQAAQRLFPEVYERAMKGTQHQDVLRGAVAGTPLQVSRDYYMSWGIIASWTLPNDVNSVTSGMFNGMLPSPMRDDEYIVPMVVGGRSVSEFLMVIDDSGTWRAPVTLIDPLPTGQIYYVEVATSILKNALGNEAEVRSTIFLPSGLIFAVGNNNGREAAVYLTFVNFGPGVGSFNKYLPEKGRFFTPDQLRSLLLP